LKQFEIKDQTRKAFRSRDPNTIHPGAWLTNYKNIQGPNRKYSFEFWNGAASLKALFVVSLKKPFSAVKKQRYVLQQKRQIAPILGHVLWLLSRCFHITRRPLPLTSIRPSLAYKSRRGRLKKEEKTGGKNRSGERERKRQETEWEKERKKEKDETWGRTGQQRETETEERDCIISFKTPAFRKQTQTNCEEKNIPVARESKEKKELTRGKANEKGKREVQSTPLSSSCFQVNFSSFAR